LAENARDRLSRKAAAGELLEARRFVPSELALCGRYQSGQVEAKCMACQNPRDEFGGFDGGGLELRGECAPRGLDGLFGEIRHAASSRKSLHMSSLRMQGPIRRGLSI